MKWAVILLAATLAGAGTVETDTFETETETEATYTEEDLWYLSRVIQAESGYCEAEMQIGVGSVLLNRVNSDLFPNTIRECVEQPGQYATAGWLSSQEPTEQVMEIAIDLLENGSQYPANVLYQANYPLGSAVYKTLYTPYSVMYFSYQ